MLMICEECSCLFIEQTSYNGSYARKIHILNSEFSNRVLLFDIVILIQHIPNDLLISVTFYSCFCQTDRRMCVIEYIHLTERG